MICVCPRFDSKGNKFDIYKIAKNDKAKSNNEVAKDKTSTPKEHLESEGQSIIDENHVDMNKDKSSGRGTLKVRFEMNSPERQSFSEKKP